MMVDVVPTEPHGPKIDQSIWKIKKKEEKNSCKQTDFSRKLVM